jgi:hypothetical protein
MVNAVNFSQVAVAARPVQAQHDIEKEASKLADLDALLIISRCS